MPCHPPRRFSELAGKPRFGHVMHMRFKVFFVVTAFFLGTLVSAAQEQAKTTTTRKRPTVGLALQGGGALGLAHVGVITWLEEHHIPVDYIAGTSMGGLVGGVYATGHNAAEMRHIVSGIPWDEVLSPRTPFQDLSFRRKEDVRDYPSTLEFGIQQRDAVSRGLEFRPAGYADSR